MPIPDKFHHALQKIIDQANPQSMEEMQALMDSLMGNPLPEIPVEEMTKAEQARELVWEAYELPIDKGRRRANKALKFDPDCIEAYEYLGQTYGYYHKAEPYYRQGVEIGRRLFGGKFLKKYKGHFYLATETRPFMRCLAGLAECYYGPGQTPEAVEIWKEMIELNPNDNQGIRYALLPALLELKELKTYDKIRKIFRSEETTMMLFSDALRSFIEKGPTAKGNRFLEAAIQSNHYVASLLLAEYPPDALPSSYTLHSEEEAIIYASNAWRAWLRQDASYWLSKTVNWKR